MVDCRERDTAYNCANVNRDPIEREGNWRINNLLLKIHCIVTNKNPVFKCEITKRWAMIYV